MGAFLPTATDKQPRGRSPPYIVELLTSLSSALYLLICYHDSRKSAGERQGAGAEEAGQGEEHRVWHSVHEAQGERRRNHATEAAESIGEEGRGSRRGRDEKMRPNQPAQHCSTRPYSFSHRRTKTISAMMHASTAPAEAP